MYLALRSPQLDPGGDIPRQFTCDGEDVSLPLAWGAAPAGPASFCLIAEDPDAPGGTFVHWLLYDLPANSQDLPENVPKRGQLPNGARQGRNGFGRTGYGGPCPPPGTAHRYFFRLYALDEKTHLAAGVSREELDRAMKGHILAQADLMGRFQRR
jgi:Raf kinase inhibitor-like YbhB/YbcL family protein